MKFVAPKKIRIFNYKKISCQLILETKGLEVTFLNEYFDLEFLFELESIITWCLSHTEVKYVLFNSKSEIFSKGFNYQDFQSYSKNKISKMYQKLHNINSSLRSLPQTTICHFKNGAVNEGLTFSLFCDLKFVNEKQNTFQFNFLESGIIDASGLLCQLSSEHSDLIRTFMLSGVEFCANELIQNKINIFSQDKLDQICLNISKQSNIARVQAKCALMTEKTEIQKKRKNVFELLNATLLVDDFKCNGEFKNLRDLKEELLENSNISQ